MGVEGSSVRMTVRIYEVVFATSSFSKALVGWRLEMEVCL